MITACKVDVRSFQFDSNEERCFIACWLAYSNYNLNREKLVKDVTDFYLSRKS
ncbi:hypothetical protein CsatB_007461 [Cannabis sativa]